MRRTPKIVQKFLSMQSLTEKVMGKSGKSGYLVNPCVVMCPFAGLKCPHGRFRMNGACKPCSSTHTGIECTRTTRRWHS